MTLTENVGKVWKQGIRSLQGIDSGEPPKSKGKPAN